VFKRFVIGFVIGIIAMQWYINNGGDIQGSFQAWFHHSSSKYSDQKTNEAARDLLNSTR